MKCCFAEAGKGGISLRDLKRVAAAHDFTWTDKEMADMICCFDSDGDGKVITCSSSVVFINFLARMAGEHCKFNERKKKKIRSNFRNRFEVLKYPKVIPRPIVCLKER